MASKGWIGVDLDGTLAEYHGWRADGSIGPPVPAMVERVKDWLAEGKDIRIFTARMSLPDGTQRLWQLLLIEEWCLEHLGKELPVTYKKDMQMIELWDDRCVRVIPNTGRRCCESC